MLKLDAKNGYIFGLLWCQSVFFGVFGKKEILGVSRIWRVPLRIFQLRFFIRCIFGCGFFVPTVDQLC